jgi:hypothetical protein
MDEPVFHSKHPWEEARIRAVAIYCSDGRWGEAFDEFCHHHLKLPRYDRFAAPGGPAWLAMRHISLLTAYSAARDHLRFLVEVHELQQVVLISHYGCAVYAELTGLDAEGCLPAQEEDLGTAAANLRGWFPALGVRAFLATRQGARIQFHPVAVGGEGSS